MKQTLFTGFTRRMACTVGIVYGLFIWSVAQGFGRPYAPGTTTDVGAAILYSLVFWAVLVVRAGRVGADRLIAAKAHDWRRISG